MPVPSSGQLRLRADINLEVNGNDTDTNVSLGTLSNDAGFTEPDTMSEFYGYSAITPPYFDGGLATANITDTYMTVVAPAVYNPDNANIKRGFYFGTSTTATSNTFYDMGNTTGSGLNYSRQFTGLSGSTTYYIWGVVRDTETPARFTEVLTPMKTQSTLADPGYSTYTASQNVQSASSGDVGGCSATWQFYYQHVYYGNTNYYNVGSSAGSGGFSGYINGANKYRYRSGGSTTNRVRAVGSMGDSADVTMIFRNDSCTTLGNASSYFNCSAPYTQSTSGSGTINLNSAGWNGNISEYRSIFAGANSGSSYNFTLEITFTG